MHGTSCTTHVYNASIARKEIATLANLTPCSYGKFQNLSLVNVSVVVHVKFCSVHAKINFANHVSYPPESGG